MKDENSYAGKHSHVQNLADSMILKNDHAEAQEWKHEELRQKRLREHKTKFSICD